MLGFHFSIAEPVVLMAIGVLFFSVSTGLQVRMARKRKAQEQE